MATDTQTQIVREDPRMEAFRLGILMDTKDMVAGRMGNEAALPPNYQVAGLTGLENQAAALGQAGIGSYVPYLQGATNQVTAGQNLIQDAALPTMGQGQEYLLESGRLAQQLREVPYQYQTAASEGLLASAGTFDPSSAQGFMNPYEDAVVQQTMQDIADQGAIQQQQQRANAVSSGAFGGSRSGIMESELAKNILREQGRAAGGLRQQGYGAALNSAQQAFENTQNRRMQASQGIGNLGINYGQLSQADVGQMQSIGQGLGGFASQYAGLGAQSANLGLQQAGLGEMAQRSNLSDIQTLTGLGAMQRGQQQAVLDATRNSNVERLAAPYQQLGFLSDMANRTPTSQSTITSKNSQDPSTAQQVLGLGIAGLGAVGGARTGLSF